MGEHASKLEHESKESVPIDDSLLRQSYFEYKQSIALDDDRDPNSKIQKRKPLPWEDGWKAFVKETKEKDQLELIEQINGLQKKKKGASAAAEAVILLYLLDYHYAFKISAIY